MNKETYWSPDSIVDEVYRDKFTKLPRIISDWVSEYGGLTGRDILDFGCGEGTTAIGIALQYSPSRVVGVDIMPDPERCLPLAESQLHLGQLPDNLALYRIEPGKLHNYSDRFELIYSWSVFEHIDQRILSDELVLLRNVLKPSGLLFVQIAPLYYSSEGSHLCQWVPEPWGHLLSQHNRYYEMLCEAVTDEVLRASLWSTYRTLNRITATHLLDMIRNTGFDIIREYRTKEECAIPPELLTVYHEEVLRTNQIVLLARPQ